MRALLEQWLRAQNEGDFAGYEGLYAQRFFGVKRAGDRRTQYGRQTWLADRRSMFQRHFEVELAELVIDAGPTTARVRFIQTWSSASFRDVGPKELLLVREGTQLRIAREEMLESRLAATSSSSPARAPDAEHFAFVKALDDGVVVLLSTTHAEPSDGLGPARLHAGYRVEREVDAARDLAAEHRAWLGRSVAVYGAGGRVCSGQVSRLIVLAEIIPHFGSVQAWEEEQRPAAARAEELWRMSEGSRWLGAKLELGADACAGARWARSEHLSSPVLYTAEEAPAPPRLLERLVAIPATRSFQREYEARGGRGPWHAGARVKHVRFRAPGAAATRPAPDEPTVSAISLSVGLPCSPELTADLLGIFRTSAGTSRLLSHPRQPTEGPASYTRGPEFPTPELAFDLEADGVPELIAGQTLLVLHGSAYLPVLNVEPVSLDCPC